MNLLDDRKIGAAIALGLLWLLGPVPLVADVVHLKNGDRLSGTVDSIDGKRVVLQTDVAGKVVLKMSSVESIETEESFDVKLKSGTKTTGRFAVDAGSQTIEAEAQAPLPVVLEEIKSAGQDNIAFVNLGSDWSTRLDLAAAISTGNSETESFNTVLESKLTRGRSEHGLYARISSEESENEKTKDQFDVKYGYKRFFAEKWFGSGNVEYFEDGLKGIDYRVTTGAGVGYQFWDNSFGALSVEAGGNWVFEELFGEKEDNPAFRWALKFNRHLWSKRAEVFHNHSVLVIPDRGEVFDSSTGLRLAINDRVDSNFRVDLQHETDPPDGSEKTDVTYSVGVGVKF